MVFPLLLGAGWSLDMVKSLDCGSVVLDSKEDRILLARSKGKA